jgi:hypothetical protein
VKSFFSMRRGEAATLVLLVGFAAFSFIPAWRTIELGGMALFGWLMVALMVVSPTIALFTFLRRGGGGGGGSDDGGGRGVPEAGGDVSDGCVAD